MKGTARFNANAKALVAKYTALAAMASKFAVSLNDAAARAKAYAEAAKYEKRAAEAAALVLA